MTNLINDPNATVADIVRKTAFNLRRARGYRASPSDLADALVDLATESETRGFCDLADDLAERASDLRILRSWAG